MFGLFAGVGKERDPTANLHHSVSYNLGFRVCWERRNGQENGKENGNFKPVAKYIEIHSFTTIISTVI